MDDYIDVIKKKNNNIVLIPNGKLDNVYECDELMRNDLTIYQSHYDGWAYMIDANTGLYYTLNDYGYDYINDLSDGKKIELCDGKKFIYTDDGEYLTEDGEKF